MRNVTDDFQIRKNFQFEIKYGKVFSNRMLFIFSVVFFLTIGTLNIIFGPAKYTATIIIPLKQIPPVQPDKHHLFSFREDQLKFMRSKGLLETAEKKLGLQVSYFKTRIFSKTELNDEYTPVNVKLIKTSLNTDYQLEIGLYSTEMCEINFAGDIGLHRFGEKIKANGCEFLVVKTTSRFYYPSITAKITGLNQLTATYSNLLQASLTPDSSGIKLSVILPNAKKAGDLLTELQSLYLKDYPNVAQKDTDLSGISNQLKKLNTQLSRLKRSNDSARLKQAAEAPVIIGNSKQSIFLPRKQLDILNVMGNYLKNPPYQFTIMPNTFHLQDNKLKGLIDKLNNSEIQRQQLLSAKPNVDALDKADQTVISLRNMISSRLDVLKRQINEQISGSGPVATKNDSKLPSGQLIDALKKQRQLTLNVYTGLLKKKMQLQIKKQSIMTPVQIQNKVSIVRNKRSVASILMLSLLAGIFIPMMFILLKAKMPVTRPVNGSNNNTDGR